MRLDFLRFATSLAVVCFAPPAVAAAQGGGNHPDPVLAAADRAWEAQDHVAALRGYREVVRRDSTALRALFRLATLLSWRGEHEPAIELLRTYVRRQPADDDARVAIARTLAWRGRYRESVATYDSVLARHPGHREAMLGLAQTLAWDGRYEEAVACYEDWVQAHAADAEAWIGLARVWRWSGRPATARQVLRRAVAVRPDHEPTRAELRALDAVLAPSLQPAVAATSDSDDNRGLLYVLEAGFATPWDGRLVAGVSHRVADLATTHGTATTLRAATTRTWAGGRWTVRGELGGTRLDGRPAPGIVSSTKTEPLLSLGLSGRPAPRIAAGVAASRAAFDETAPLIVLGLASTTLEGDVALALHRQVSLDAGGAVTRLAGGSVPNRRLAGWTALRWTARPRVSMAAAATTFGYARAAADGYFAPSRYLLAEGSIRARIGTGPGWGVQGEAGFGRQSVTTFGDTTTVRLASRLSAEVVYRRASATEWSVSGGMADVASPSTVSAGEYRSWRVAVGSRLRL